MENGMLLSETNIFDQNSKKVSSNSSVQSSNVECLSTCYDISTGSLWTCSFDSNQIIQFAACPHMPRQVTSSLMIAKKEKSSEENQNSMKPIEAAKKLMGIMSRRAKEVSPSEVHVQACAEARARLRATHLLL